MRRQRAFVFLAALFLASDASCELSVFDPAVGRAVRHVLSKTVQYDGNELWKKQATVVRQASPTDSIRVQSQLAAVVVEEKQSRRHWRSGRDPVLLGGEHGNL